MTSQFTNNGKISHEAWARADEAFDALNALLDASGSLESQNIQRAMYELRLQIVRGLQDNERIKAAEACLRELSICELNESVLTNTAVSQVTPPAKHNKLHNVLGQVAVPPFYIRANGDCDNKTDDFISAKAIRLALFNEGCESVHIVDADGVEVVDSEIECHESLAQAGYFAGLRKAEVNPDFKGAFMVNDPQDPDGFAIVGDDAGLLILEAQAQLIDPTVAQGQPQAKNPDAFNYQLLGRLKQDCDYYLGNGGRAKKHLWAGDVPAQIAKMNELFAGFSEKPQWISLEDICSYEAQMSNATVLTPSMTSGNTAYEATVEDVENVLRSNSLAVANTHGMSFESLAEKLHGDLDFGLIEQAALAGDELDEQTGNANDEIARQLREKGVLESSKMVDGDVHPSAFEIKQSFSDGEVICKDNDGALIQSDATNKESYNSGQSAAEFGMDNLSEIEVQRLNMKG